MKGARELIDRFDAIPAAKPVMTRKEATGLGAGEWSAVHWVEPVMLCEVSFTEWTDDGRIRHPSFQGLREDKDAADVKQEKPMPSSALKKPERPRLKPKRALWSQLVRHKLSRPGYFRDWSRDERRTRGISRGRSALYVACENAQPVLKTLILLPDPVLFWGHCPGSTCEAISHYRSGTL